MTYLVIAYRWGWTNAHQYHVYAGPDETKARALAVAEADDRGGKYGCAVMKFDADGTDCEMIEYAPSIYGEEKPSTNHRIDMFKSLGHKMYEYADGRVYLPSAERPGVLESRYMEPPEWVVSEVERAEGIATTMAEIAKCRSASA